MGFHGIDIGDSLPPHQCGGLRSTLVNMATGKVMFGKAVDL